MPPSYAHILDWIQSQEAIALERLKKWVAINTFYSFYPGLESFIQCLKQDFSTLEGEVYSQDLASYSLVDKQGNVEEKKLGQAFSIRKRTEAPYQILLAGHYDTVHSPHHSFQLVDDKDPKKWKGPGIADMKGGLAVLLLAVQALERSMGKEKLGWEILITPDEEIGSPGSARLYQQAAKRHQIGLIFEPSLPSGTLAGARKGSINYTIIVKGRTAHVGRDFNKGRSAVFALADFIYCANQMNKEEMSVNITDLSGEGPLNIVPDLASCRVNCRSFSPLHLQEANKHLHQIANRLMQQEGITITIFEDTNRPPKRLENCQYVFEKYKNAANRLHIPCSLEATGGVCDGNILAAAGLPTLDTVGVIGGALHTKEEYMLVDSLVERAKIAALFLVEIAQGIKI